MGPDLHGTELPYDFAPVAARKKASDYACDNIRDISWMRSSSGHIRSRLPRAVSDFKLAVYRHIPLPTAVLPPTPI